MPRHGKTNSRHKAVGSAGTKATIAAAFALPGCAILHTRTVTESHEQATSRNLPPGSASQCRLER